jgi:pyruvate dehydrogenase E2 component (dihydrolipoamide acetyltransferase)
MVIAEIETDKATMEVEAVDEGRVGKILIDAGTEGVKVNTPIAVLLEEGEDEGAISQAQAPAGKPGDAAPQQAGGPPATNDNAPAAAGSAAAPPAPATIEMGREVAPAPKTAGGERIFVSPLARRLAVEAGLDLGQIDGSGPRGRIVKRDIEKVVAAGGAASQKAAPTTGERALTVPTTPLAQAMSDDKILALYEEENYEIVPHDGMRKIIAERLTQSKQTIPHFYLTIECVLDELLRARARMNEAAPKDGPRAYKLSVNDFVIKALALALQQVPAANATWTEQGMLRHRHSDIGVAVAVEGGLFTPVIRHAEFKSLGEISNEMKELAERARNRRLAPHEYQGGTTSISNLGMFGIKSFDAVINPPHATILAVGAGEKRAIVDGDQVRVATVMSCTLSCDHRVVDGALGAELLNAFKGFIEDPVRMLV